MLVSVLISLEMARSYHRETYACFQCFGVHNGMKNATSISCMQTGFRGGGHDVCVAYDGNAYEAKPRPEGQTCFEHDIRIFASNKGEAAKGNI